MTPSGDGSDGQGTEAVARYKQILKRIVDNRPSGTRQRLAGALGKNPSFISQIINPTYATPIPPSHIDTIFEICHFSQSDRKSFLEAYAKAHPRRVPATRTTGWRLRAHTVYLPDFADDRRNRELDRMVADFVQKLIRLINHSPP